MMNAEFFKEMGIKFAKYTLPRGLQIEMIVIGTGNEAVTQKIKKLDIKEKKSSGQASYADKKDGRGPESGRCL